MLSLLCLLQSNFLCCKQALLSNHLLICQQSVQTGLTRPHELSTWKLSEQTLSASEEGGTYLNMETQKFNLCWNEFDKAASLTLKCLVEDQDFTDVTISCDDQQMQVVLLISGAF